MCKPNPIDPAQLAKYAQNLVDRDRKASEKNNGGSSDPCFEVWLVDHVMVCPSHVTTQRKAESLAKSKGLTTGRGNKYLVSESLRGFVGAAVMNADKHNDQAVAACRKSLQGASFAPWTDFPELIRSVGVL